jgi:hypothetical protein
MSGAAIRIEASLLFLFGRRDRTSAWSDINPSGKILFRQADTEVNT